MTVPRSRLAVIPAVIAVLAFAALGCGDDGDDNGGDEPAGQPAEFDYEGEIGPDRWAELDPDYAECAAGREQSPIELEPAEPGRQPPIRFDYAAGPAELVNNGHSVELEPESGNAIEIGDHRYELDQVHYHAPSEHRVGDEQLPLELHFVHRDEDDGLAVLAVGAVEGAENPAFAGLVDALPGEEGDSAELEGEIDPIALMPERPGSIGRFSYDGSLTTPPCSEGVRWEVLGDPIELSREQLDRFTAVYEGNNRPLQPREGRRVIAGR